MQTFETVSFWQQNPVRKKYHKNHKIEVDRLNYTVKVTVTLFDQVIIEKFIQQHIKKSELSIYIFSSLLLLWTVLDTRILGKNSRISYLSVFFINKLCVPKRIEFIDYLISASSRKPVKLRCIIIYFSLRRYEIHHTLKMHTIQVLNKMC